MLTPVVSVLTVTYNHGRFIRQCLESILMQKTTFPFEIIIGEDCSTDDTRSIVKEFEARYPDIIKAVYHDKNVGGLRNVHEFVIPRAQGKYIAVCEGDDYWTDENKLQKQVEFLDANPQCSFCFHEYTIIDHDNNVLANRPTIDHVKYYSPSDVFHLRPQLVTVMFRNCLDLTTEQRLELKMSDLLLFVRLAKFGGAADLGFVGAVYRKHQGGIYQRMKEIEQYVQIIKGLRDIKKLWIVTEEQKKEIDKEIMYRKKIFMLKMLRKRQILNSVKVAIA